jgi:ribosomal protein L37AE/L43A
MQCPKCGGDAYLVEEELVQVLENVEPPKVIAKAIYQCKSCGERFSRLVYEDLTSRKKDETVSSRVPPIREEGGEPLDTLRFF